MLKPVVRKRADLDLLCKLPNLQYIFLYVSFKKTLAFLSAYLYVCLKLEEESLDAEPCCGKEG